MLDYSSIRNTAEEKGREAKESGTLPARVKGANLDRAREFIRTIPFLSDHVPEGVAHSWRLLHGRRQRIRRR